MRCLTLMPMEWQGMAAREKAALFNVDAHEVALAAREETASALFNAYAHGVAVHGSSRGGCTVKVLTVIITVKYRQLVTTVLHG